MFQRHRPSPILVQNKPRPVSASPSWIQQPNTPLSVSGNFVLPPETPSLDPLAHYRHITRSLQTPSSTPGNNRPNKTQSRETPVIEGDPFGEDATVDDLRLQLSALRSAMHLSHTSEHNRQSPSPLHRESPTPTHTSRSSSARLVRSASPLVSSPIQHTNNRNVGSPQGHTKGSHGTNSPSMDAMWLRKVLSSVPSNSQTLSDVAGHGANGRLSAMEILEKHNINSIPFFPSPTIRFETERWMNRRNLGTGSDLTQEIVDILADCFLRLNCRKDGTLKRDDSILLIQTLGLEKYQRDLEQILQALHLEKHRIVSDPLASLSCDLMTEALRRLRKARGKEVVEQIISSEGRRLELGILSQNHQRREKIEGLVKKYSKVSTFR